MNQNAFGRGQVIGRQLHDKRRGLAFEQAVFQHQAGEHGGDDADKVKAEHDVLPVVREKSRRKQHIHRQARPARHKRCHGNRHQAVAPVLERAGGHHGRHVAAEAHNQRHKAFARQADPAHKTIHHKSRARHIAGIFKHGKKKIQKADNRNKRGHGLNAAADAVGQEQIEPFGRTCALQQRFEAVYKHRAEKLIEKIDKCAADVDGKHKHQIHHQQKNGNAQHAVEHNAVDALGEVAAGAPAVVHGSGGQLVGQAVTRIGHHNVDVVAQRGGFGFGCGQCGGRGAFLRQRIAFEQAHRQPAR